MPAQGKRGGRNKQSRGMIKVDGMSEFNPDNQAGLGTNSRITITDKSGRDTKKTEKKGGCCWVDMPFFRFHLI